MKDKVLMNVYSIGVKNDILSILVQNGYEFLEANTEHDLAFKYNLIKDRLDLYIHELDENDYDNSLELIKKMDLSSVRCIVLIHKYSSKVIDDTLALKVNDIIVLPIERPNLKKKILSTATKPEANDYMPSTPVVQDEIIIDKERISDEINRAVRGDYPLSFVLIEYERMGIEVFKVFKRELRKLLRTTDKVMKFSKNRLLILCPFTPKSYLVEVENKVRKAHEFLGGITVTPTKIFLYGVTFPDDGQTSDMLMKAMDDGIHDSRVFSSLEGTLHKMDKVELRTRLKRDY